MVAAKKAAVPLTFRVVPGSRLNKHDGEIIGREFMRLRREGKQLTKELLVEEARSADSVLHAFFEWNDRKAAHQFRLTQAAKLLRSIEVVVHGPHGKPTSVKGFYNVETETGGRRWEPMKIVFEDVELADQVIGQARAQLDAWIARFNKYQWAAKAIPFARKALKAL